MENGNTYTIWSNLTRTGCKKKIVCILIQIFIIAFKIGSFWANTSMPTVNAIFYTLLIGLCRYSSLLLQGISFYGLNWLTARYPERIFEFWKKGKVIGRQIWRIRWLSNDFCFVFSQKFSYNQAGMWRSIIVVWRQRASFPKHEPQCVEPIRKRCWEPLLPF